MNEKRLQQVAEQILTDSSLTDDMNDAEATHLIDWAVDVAKALALQTANMDDATAEDYLYPPMKHLRKTVKRINKLFAEMRDIDDVGFQELLTDIYGSAREVYVLDVSTEPSAMNYQQMASMSSVEQVKALLAPISMPSEESVKPLKDPGPMETQPMQALTEDDLESLEGFGFDVTYLKQDNPDQKDE